MWKTEQEIKYLINIGHTMTNPPSRLKLLAGYLEGCEKRERWGEIEKDEVIDFVKRQLN